MNKTFLVQQKEKLEKARQTLREELERFASEDPKLTGDWDTRFPRHDGGTGSSALEDATDEVEEYATRLPIEFSFETRLKDITLALEKIKRGGYGICENCKKRIPIERLKASPEARKCVRCGR